jgi:hypothetical protein
MVLALVAVKETPMPMLPQTARPGLTPNAFVSEVARFEQALADPGLPADEKAQAYALIVKHAGQLDPRDPGFERAGVALKEALCAWLCCPGADH